jgi:hypothetical protein
VLSELGIRLLIYIVRQPKLTERLFRPHPIQDILDSLLLDPAAPLPVSISRSTAPSGRTGSVAM